MALFPCPECGQKISDNAAICPHCGCPREQWTTSGYTLLLFGSDIPDVFKLHEEEMQQELKDRFSLSDEEVKTATSLAAGAIFPLAAGLSYSSAWSLALTLSKYLQRRCCVVPEDRMEDQAFLKEVLSVTRLRKKSLSHTIFWAVFAALWAFFLSFSILFFIRSLL